VITTGQGPEARHSFLEALRAEIRHAAEHYGRFCSETLYFGGGTPSLLTPAELESIFKTLRADFDLVKDAEITLEANPADVNVEKFAAFKELGVNRISLGAQAFQDHLLQDMGRNHSATEIAIVFDVLRDIGFKNISLDLMLFLPGQSVADFEASLKAALQLTPEQLTLYDLEVEPRSYYGKLHSAGRLNLPNENEHYAMTDRAQNLLLPAGYTQYEVSTFARAGYESRHNLLYWHNQEYLGLGPGAFSYLNGTRSRLAPSVPRYMEKAERKDWVPEMQEVLDEDKQAVESLVTGIRLREGVSLTALGALGKRVFERSQESHLQEFVRVEADRIYLTDEGKCLVDKTVTALMS